MVLRYLIVIAALLAVALGTPVEVQICGGKRFSWITISIDH